MWNHESNELWHNRHYTYILFGALTKKKKKKREKKKSLTCACKQTLNGQRCTLTSKEKHLHPKKQNKKTRPQTKECLLLLGSRPSQAVIAARQGHSHPIPRHHDETATNQLILSLRNLQVAVPRDFSFSFEFGNQRISRLNGVHFSNPIPVLKTSLWTSTEKKKKKKAERQRTALPSARLRAASLIRRSVSGRTGARIERGIEQI